jgi:hypothetical protein
MKTLLVLAVVLSAAPAHARPAKGQSATVFTLGDNVSFFFSMREESPGSSEKTVVWQRWQLSCRKNGTCTGLTFYKLSDDGPGEPCHVGMEDVGDRFQTVRFDLTAGDVAVKVTDEGLGTGELRIRFDPKSNAIRTAEVAFLQKADSAEDIADSPFARDKDEIRKFRMPLKSSIVRPACVFLEEGAAPLP